MASKFVSFDPGKDIPSLAGKVIFTTGANTDLGKHSALELAKHNPSQISVASRNAKKGNAAVAEVKEAVLGLLPKPLLASTTRLDILLLSAGILGHPPALTKDGYEVQLGTNQLGHAPPLKLLTSLLIKTASNPTGTGMRGVT
ncbi:hypothetical protein H2203_000412 [Taxawa tesnikishii (nom. ined.)]|nr:hypothetical protein H2203_000412 [Dothideales sp. JES 119]